MNILMFILQLLLLFAGGFLLGSILIPTEHKVEKIALGFLLNLGLFTYIWFILNIFNVPYNYLSSFVVVAGLFVFFYFINKILNKSFDLKLLTRFKNYSNIDKFLLGIVGIILLSSIINNFYWPVKTWDSLALYDFRAIIFAQTGFMNEGLELGYFFHYPFFTSLVHTWARVSGIYNPMFFYTLLFTSFLGCFYFSLRKFISKPLSLFWTVVVAISPMLYEHSQIAYTNLPYSIFIILAVIYFYRYIESHKLGLVIVSSLLLSFSAWNRYTEPFWMGVLGFVMVYLLYKKQFKHTIIYVVIFIIFKYIWLIYLSHIGLGDYSGGGIVSKGISEMIKNINLNDLKDVIVYLNKNVFLFWGGSIVAFLLLFIQNKKHLLYFFQVLILVGMLVGGTYLFSFTFPGWADIPDSAARMAMFFPPLFIYYIGITFNLSHDKK